MRFFKVLLIVGVVVVCSLAGTQVEAVIFDINFDATFDTQTKRDALQFAADTWGGLLKDNFTGETVTINATFNFGGPPNALAGTSPLGAVYDPTLPHFGAPNFFYPIALANHLAGHDINGATAEIAMEFNPNPTTLIGPTPWYFGTDGNTPVNHIDFASNALHEITHGLGMISGMNGDGSLDFTVPGSFDTGYIYDAFVQDATTTQFPIGQLPLVRANTLVNGDLRFAGVSATAANGGVPPQLFVPNPFRDGSSVVHLDPLFFPGELMRPNLGVGPGTATHSPSDIDLGIIKGVGWTVAQAPEPATFWLLGSGLAGLLLARRRARSSEKGPSA